MNGTEPTVTLITPVYDQAEYLKEYIACVRDQTWRPLQVIFVDDGSEDGSGELLDEAAEEASDGLMIKVIRTEHKGQAHAFNLALAEAEGEFLAWCDADDLMTAGSIEKKVRYLLQHTGEGMVRTNGELFDMDAGEVTGEYAKADDKGSRMIFDDLLYDRTYCYSGAYMIRTDLLFECYPDKRIPESDEGQNLQLLLPPSSRSTCGYIDEKLHTYRQHSGSHSQRERTYTEALERITNFTKLRLELIDRCRCDAEKYTQAVMKIEESSRRSLLKAAAEKARGRKSS